MKDLTSTSFGLLIAFLLPGISGLFTASFLFPGIKELFATFLKSNANIGLFLIVILAALALGLMLTALRWLFFEKWLYSNEPHKSLRTDSFKIMGEKTNIRISFRAVVDEHYRYHQFWGGMFFVIPFLFLFWSYDYCEKNQKGLSLLLLILGIILTYISFRAAKEALKLYYARANAIFGGEKCQTDGEQV